MKKYQISIRLYYLKYQKYQIKYKIILSEISKYQIIIRLYYLKYQKYHISI